MINNSVIGPLYLFISQATGYINKFDKNKITMSLVTKDIQLLKKYNKIWKKILKLMKIDFNAKTTDGDDDDKYIKTKIKTYKDSITTNFYNKNGFKKIQEEKPPHKCLSIIILDSIIYTYENYYPQIFLECKYAKENIKNKNYIDEELKSESESDIDTDTNSDNEE